MQKLQNIICIFLQISSQKTIKKKEKERDKNAYKSVYMFSLLKYDLRKSMQITFLSRRIKISFKRFANTTLWVKHLKYKMH